MALISVILPVLNAEMYISDCIQSILQQTYTNFELLIYNDGSSDNTEQIIKSFNDTRIVYTARKKQAGYVDLLNKGIEEARGIYIARMDADDIALPERFETQINFLEKNPKVGICGSWFQFFGDLHDVQKSPVTFSEVKQGLFYGCPLTHPTIMMRKDLLDKFCLRYDDNYRFAEDHEFFWRCSFHFDIVNLPFILLKYRKHGEQIGSRKWMQQFEARGRIQAKIFAKALKYPSESDIYWLESFFTDTCKPDAIWEQLSNTYRNRIKDENRQTLVYEEDALNQAVDRLFATKLVSNVKHYFFREYYNAPYYSRKLLFSFLKEKYKGWQFLGAKLTIYFILKCLVSYRKNSSNASGHPL